MDHPGVLLIVFGVAAVFALVLANAYFVATEFALVAVRRSEVQLWLAEGRRGARAADEAITHLDDAIAATQLGITLASIGLGWIGEPALASLIQPTMEALGLGHMAAVHTVAVAIAFSLITFLHVVAGELAPKAVALDRPGWVALACAPVLLWFARIVRPVLVLMNGAGNALVRAFGVEPAGGAHRVHSPDELRLLVAEARRAGLIRPDTGRMLGNVFRLARTKVSEVMVPRDAIVAIDRRIPLDELLELIRDEGYTRLPVYDGELDRIVGVLHTKDVFHIYAERRLFVLEDIIRPALEMDPELNIADALRRFRRGRKHLAVVREPASRVVGIVTLEDVLEEIVGDIEDEHDEPTSGTLS